MPLPDEKTIVRGQTLSEILQKFLILSKTTSDPHMSKLPKMEVTNV